MNNKTFFFEYLIIFNLLCFYFINSEVIFVYEHCRHGARGPLIKFMSKLLDNKTIFYDEFNIPWFIDDEDLTIKGKMQHYILGIRNRYKYSKLLNFAKYNPNELLIHSTNYRRSNQSTYYQLLGMFNPIISQSKYNYNNYMEKKISQFYYPPNYFIWKKTLNNNNINKNIIKEAEISIGLLLENNNNTNIFLDNNKKKNDFVYEQFLENRTFYVKNKCKNYKKYMEYNYNEKYKELIIENFEKKYNGKLSEYFGYKKEDLYPIQNSISKVDNYIVNYHEERNMEYFFNFTKIDKDEFYETCIKIYKWWLYNISCDKIIGSIESSKLMEDLIEYMDNKINEKNEIKMVIDFAHDVTVGSIEILMHQAFNVDYEVCEFACNIFFELHKINGKNEKNEFFVEYYIDDDLKLNISYGLFKNKILELIWTDKEKDDFCLGNILLILYPNFFLFLIFLFIIIFIGLCVLFVNKCCLSTKKKSIENIHKGHIKENNENDKEMDLINNN